MNNTQHWLTPEEQRKVIKQLLLFGLIKCDPRRNLPLKSGGKTDIYINLRDARKDSRALEFVSKTFANPLRRLNLNRFAEIPNSVSCFAGPIAIETGLPFTTVRDDPKPGRATDSLMISGPNFGDKVAIIDDVVTDGTSKIVPIRLLEESGCKDVSLVVLVDRQQGWQKRFSSKGITTPVWSGMTLHDIRRYLVEEGIMKRCPTEVEEKNPIIVSLDGMSWGQTLVIVDRLRTTGCIIKVNDLMFEHGFANLLPDLSVYGRVMVDLKGHDIPNTIRNIAEKMRDFKPWAVTLHASGQREMIRRAVEAFAPFGTRVLAVTLLTSMDDEMSREVYGRTAKGQVLNLAKIAMDAGAHGLVCSPKEVKKLRALYPNAILVTPGVRSPGVAPGDQARTDTPKNTMALGANHLVMGRQLFESEDPVVEVARVLSEELGIT